MELSLMVYLYFFSTSLVCCSKCQLLTNSLFKQSKILKQVENYAYHADYSW